MAAESAFCGKLSLYKTELQHSRLTRAFLIFATQWQDVATMTAPIGPHIGEVLESVWDAMIELLLIRVGFRVRFADAFGDDLRVTLFMARVFTIRALHTRGVFKELSAKSTTHDVVELLKYELMAVKFMHFFLALTDGAFTVETNVEGSSIFELFC